MRRFPLISQLRTAPAWRENLAKAKRKLTSWCKYCRVKDLISWRIPPGATVLLSAIICLALWTYAVVSARQLTERLIVGTSELQERMAGQVRLIGVILQRSSDLERKAKLVVLLSDPSIKEPYERDSYENSRVVYLKSMRELGELASDSEVIFIIQELIEIESLIHRHIGELEGHVNSSQGFEEAFTDFNDLTMKLAIRMDVETRAALAENVASSRNQLMNYQLQNAIALASGLTLLGVGYAFSRRKRPT